MRNPRLLELAASASAAFLIDCRPNITGTAGGCAACINALQLSETFPSFFCPRMAPLPDTSQNQPSGGAWLKARIHDCLLHIQVLGLLRGLVVWLRAYALRLSFDIPVTVPGVPTPVILRSGGSDMEVFKKIFLDQEYRLPFDARPATILDLGANTGLASLYFRTQFPEAQIVAVEPDPANFAMMQRHLGVQQGVVLVQAAVWSHDGQITLTDPGVGSWGLRVHESSSEVCSGSQVPAVSMPSLLGHFPGGRVDLLKMDVEGAEKEVFESSAAWIEKIDAIVIELHDRYKPGCNRAFFTAIQSLPYERLIGENFFVWRQVSGQLTS